MIFLSHNYNDKPIVEQIANRLQKIYGQENIFYDSWSIQPGDGIIDKMNQGLEECRLFLFFVSKNSLQSEMVKLEWQTAIIRVTKGKSKIIPVKLDDCMMPAILLQTLYIDLFGQGLEVALRQIEDITAEKNTYREGAQQFSNLRAIKHKDGEKLKIVISAEYFMEPVSHFIVLTNNDNKQVEVKIDTNNIQNIGYYENHKFDEGLTSNVFFLSLDKSTVPGHPVTIVASPINGSSIDIFEVRHEKSMNNWVPIPLADAPEL